MFVVHTVFPPLQALHIMVGLFNIGLGAILRSNAGASWWQMDESGFPFWFGAIVSQQKLSFSISFSLPFGVVGHQAKIVSKLLKIITKETLTCSTHLSAWGDHSAGYVELSGQKMFMVVVTSGCSALQSEMVLIMLFVWKNESLKILFVWSFPQFVMFGAIGILSEKYPSPCLVSGSGISYSHIIFQFTFISHSSLISRQKKI